MKIREEIDLTLHKTEKATVSPLLDGLYKKNTVLISGLVIAPAVVGTSTLHEALMIALAFTLITFFTVIISSYIPRTLVYTIRIILYTLIASLVYVPVIILIYKINGELSMLQKVILPLLVMNSLIVSKSEMRFFRRQKNKMVVDLIMYILGFDIVVIVMGFIREVFGHGTLGSKLIGISFTIPVLKYTCGGFILIGLLAALFRKIMNIVDARKKV